MISLPSVLPGGLRRASDRPEGTQRFCLTHPSPVTYPSHHDIATSDRSERPSARTTRKAISYQSQILNFPRTFSPRDFFHASMVARPPLAPDPDQPARNRHARHRRRARRCRPAVFCGQCADDQRRRDYRQLSDPAALPLPRAPISRREPGRNHRRLPHSRYPRHRPHRFSKVRRAIYEQYPEWPTATRRGRSSTTMAISPSVSTATTSSAMRSRSSKNSSPPTTSTASSSIWALPDPRL